MLTEYLEIKQIADTTIEQMGGRGMLTAMIGASFPSNYFWHDDKCDLTVTIHFSFKGSRKYNECDITYNRAQDLYSMELVKSVERKTKRNDSGWGAYGITMVDRVKCLELHMLTGDQLAEVFTRHTGLYVTL